MNVNLIKSGATYATKRQTYYPLLAEQIDLLYHAIDAGKFGDTAKTSDFYVKLKAVKDKYPKG
jgi:hypothetical protein|tara:strand:- start:1016 stop:1204 length:189 start_codon:yes stop_codon:yes gene_type:complete